MCIIFTGHTCRQIFASSKRSARQSAAIKSDIPIHCTASVECVHFAPPPPPPRAPVTPVVAAHTERLTAGARAHRRELLLLVISAKDFIDYYY